MVSLGASDSGLSSILAEHEDTVHVHGKEGWVLVGDILCLVILSDCLFNKLASFIEDRAVVFLAEFLKLGEIADFSFKFISNRVESNTLVFIKKNLFPFISLALRKEGTWNVAIKELGATAKDEG